MVFELCDFDMGFRCSYVIDGERVLVIVGLPVIGKSCSVGFFLWRVRSTLFLYIRYRYRCIPT